MPEQRTFGGDHIEFHDNVFEGKVVGLEQHHHEHHHYPPAVPAPPPVESGQPISQLRALELEVHPAIDAGAVAAGMDELPTYIRRPHDEVLAQRVAEAQSQAASRLVVLVGESATGKTRACWEAVRSLGEPWRLWHPISPGRPEALLAGLDAVRPYTVVWLNEAQHYLRTPGNPAIGEQVAAALRDLLRTPDRGPVVVLGTLWPRYWAALTDMPDENLPDPHAQARALLTGTALAVPAAFTPGELADAAAVSTSDPRLMEALEYASDGQLTQYLAGGPALVERYRTADAVARAVVDVAIDARRLGYGLALPRSLLEQAAAGYLTGQQWDLLAEVWPERLEQAFAYLTDSKACRGVRPPLTRIRRRPGATVEQGDLGEGKPTYRLSDYLEQYGAQQRFWVCPPAAFWQAVSCHSDNIDDCLVIGMAAADRGRYRLASMLWQRAIDLGGTESLYNILLLWEQIGDSKGAERLAGEVAKRGKVEGIRYLAELREEAEDWEEAKRLYRIAVEAGDMSAAQSLARLQSQSAEIKKEEKATQAWTRTGSSKTVGDLVRQREGSGQLEDAESLVRAEAEGGNTGPLRSLAWERLRAGDLSSAEELFRIAAQAGDLFAVHGLIKVWAEVGVDNLQELEHWTEVLWESRDPICLWAQALLCEQNGEHKEAEQWYYQFALSSDPFALFSLVMLRERLSDGQKAEWLACAGTRARNDLNTFALHGLGELREKAGKLEDAERLYRLAINAGSTGAMRDLAGLREHAGDHEEAERLARAATSAEDAEDVGGTGALWDLVNLREEAGNSEDAERLARVAIEMGDASGLAELVRSRAEAGNVEGAERLAWAAADAGNFFPLSNLARLRKQAGDHDETEQIAPITTNAGTRHGDGTWGDLLRFGLEADGRIADPW
ncbi:hypothetical protein ACQP2K_17355 [Microbispora siamensis]